MFENSKDVFASFDQVTKSRLPYFTQRSFLHIFNPFDSVVLPLRLVKKPCIWMLNGRGAGHRMDHDSNCAKYL